MENTVDNKRGILIILFIIAFIPFFAGGFYYHLIKNNLVFFWSAEIVTWMIIPSITFILVKKQIINLEDFGFQIFSPSIKLFLHFIFIPIILSLIHHYSVELARVVFPNNYLATDFSYFEMYPQNFALVIVVTFYYAFTAGFFEEFLYRGLLYKIINYKNKNIILYLILSSLLFSLGHWAGGIINIIATFAFGIFCASYFAITKNIWPLIFGHFSYDIILFTYYAGLSKYNWLHKLLSS
jgi:membrane protease YdiL (CAAX protease family)